MRTEDSEEDVDRPVDDRDGTRTGDAEKDGGEPPREENVADALGSAGQTDPTQVFKLVLNTFAGAVNAQGSTFGFGVAERSEAIAATGMIGEAAVRAAVDHFVRPGSYAEAYEGLRLDGVVALVGEPGRGKRTGALALLNHTLPAGSRTVSLSPAVTLRQLADRDYKTGHGYALFDWFGKDGGQEAEHAWQTVCAKVREASAYFVVTMIEKPRPTPESIRHVPWSCPEVRAAVRAHLLDDTAAQVVDEIIEHLPDGTAMADIVRIANQVQQGAEPGPAVDDVLDQSIRQEVKDWFDGEPSRREIIDITTLAFLTGVSERAFDTARERFADVLDRTSPAPTTVEPAADEAAAADAEPLIAQDRRRLRDNPLITLDLEVIDGVRRRGLIFREADQRRYVLEELIDGFGVPFWDAVRAWLDEVVLDESLQLSVAAGLALLAYSSFDEIEASYLDSWATGEHGWPNRYTAVYTLWFMCFDEALAPIALRTAARWAGQGPVERHTAVVAFAGELGVRYPTEAAQRLWHLVAQHNDLSEVAVAGFGNLFATLIARDAEAGHVVRLLATRLRKVSPYGRTRVRYRWTLQTALAVVEARNPVSGRPAITEYLAGQPDRIAMVGPVWAALLKHRPTRHAALRALLDALRALDSFSDDPEGDAKALGDALGGALPEPEHAPLTTDFTNLARRSGAERQRSNSLAKIMLAALGRATQLKLGGLT